MDSQSQTPLRREREITQNVDISKVRFEIIDDEMAEILSRKTPAERIRSVDHFWQLARAITRAAIRTEHPGWDTDRVNNEIAHRISNGLVKRATDG